MEKWKEVKDWEEKYLVSDLGRVKSLITNKIIIGDKNNCGYRRVTFYNGDIRERVFVHRLVAKTFIPTEGMKDLQVNHIDGNKENNTVLNLEWVTQSENELHAIKLGLKGIWRGNFKVIYDNGEEEIHDNQRAFARKIKTSSTQVRNWLNKNSKTFTKHGIKEIYYCN